MEEKREEVIKGISDMLRRNSFTFEFKVKKNPKGIKVIYEVTQEQYVPIYPTNPTTPQFPIWPSSPWYVWQTTCETDAKNKESATK